MYNYSFFNETLFCIYKTKTKNSNFFLLKHMTIFMLFVFCDLTTIYFL